jgi:hypothetical protein
MAAAKIPRALFQIIAGVQQPIDFGAVLSSLLDLVEVAIVREERTIGFLIRPIGLLGPPRHVSIIPSLLRS